VSKGSRQNGSVPSVKRLALTVRFFSALSETSFGAFGNLVCKYRKGTRTGRKDSHLTGVHLVADIKLASIISYEG
jgi:hypothetical protein